MFDRLLAEEWVEVPLGSLAQLRRGITYSTDLLDSDKNGLPYINMKSFLKGGGFNLKGVKEYSGSYLDEDLVCENDLLIANTDVTSGDIIGSPALLPDEFNGNKVLYSHHVTRLRLNDKITANFLSHLLKLPIYRKYMLQNARGTTVLMLDMEAVKKITIKYPSNILVQERICRILDTLDTQIRQTEAIIAKLQQVKQGLLHDFLTRGIDENGQLRPPYDQAPELYKDSPLGWIPKGWEVQQLRELTVLITSGSRGWAAYYAEEGPLFLRSQNIRMGRMDLSDRQCVNPPVDKEGQRTRVEPLDLLVTITGNGVGNLTYLSGDWSETAFVSQHVALVRFVHTGLAKLANHYLVLGGPGRRQIVDAQYGQSKPGLNLDSLKDICIPNPPSTERDEIVAKIDTIDARVDNEVSSVEELRSVKSGLMDDLLTGRVRVNELIEQQQQQASSPEQGEAGWGRSGN